MIVKSTFSSENGSEPEPPSTGTFTITRRSLVLTSPNHACGNLTLARHRFPAVVTKPATDERIYCRFLKQHKFIQFYSSSSICRLSHGRREAFLYHRALAVIPGWLQHSCVMTTIERVSIAWYNESSIGNTQTSWSVLIRFIQNRYFKEAFW